MTVIPTEIEGLFIIEPRVFNDSRGYFFESYSKRDFEAQIAEIDFVLDNEFASSKGILKGFHFQKPPYSQAILVRCVRGAILDIAVDLRKSSHTYGKSVAVELSSDNHRQFFIPKGFAHGFEVLSDIAVFQYKCDEYYHPEVEGGISLFDGSLNIDWQIKPEEATISDKDRKLPLLSEFYSPFE